MYSLLALHLFPSQLTMQFDKNLFFYPLQKYDTFGLDMSLQVLCGTVEDEPQFRDLIVQWIAEGSVPEFLVFVGESEKKRQSRKRRYQEETKEAEEALREMRADTSECGKREQREGCGLSTLLLLPFLH